MRRIARIAGLVTIACLLQTCASVPDRKDAFAPWLSDSASDESLLVVTVRNAPLSLALRGGSSSRDYGPGEDYGPSARASGEVRTLARQYNLREVNAWPIQVLAVHCVVFAAPKQADVDALLARLREDERVESAQRLQSFATLAANSAAKQTDGLTEPYAHLQANLAPMEVMQAHRVTRGDGVRVAVIDTGVDAAHPDLKGRIAEQRDFAAATPATLAANAVQSLPPERHGTAVAGLIAARDDNRQGIVGVAPASRILALRACWQRSASDARAVCNTFTLAQALSAAIELRANVVNLSLTGPVDPLLTRLVKAGIERGMVYVGAIPSDATLGFPTNVPGVIRVASVSGTAEQNTLRAPGDELLTLTPAGGYDFLSGSSLAAANVSGGVALLLSRRPKLGNLAVSNALSASMRAPNGVNLCAALVRVDRSADCERE